MNRPPSTNSAARAFARVGWRKLLESFHRFATARLRLAPLDASQAGRVEAGDLVNTLVVKGLDGTLAWNLAEDASEDEIVGYACIKMFGMRSTLCRKLDRTACDDALEERPDEAPDALSLLAAHRAIDAVMRALEHDAEASRHLGMMLEGNKRADIMRGLGCTAAHANTVRMRIVRAVAALQPSENDTCDEEPPSSGPRGRDHGQATEERRGAPPEPDRGAGRAGGRR